MGRAIDMEKRIDELTIEMKNLKGVLGEILSLVNGEENNEPETEEETNDEGSYDGDRESDTRDGELEETE